MTGGNSATAVRRGFGAVVLCGTALLALTACAGQAPVAAPTPTATFVPGVVEAPEMLIAPLTGVPVHVGTSDAAALGGPALSAKIDNHSAARPQLGLEHADLVFEELVEGGLTRYIAVWHSTLPEEIGPVRSIRPMDPDIVSPFGGVIAYSGGQPRFVELMRATGVVNAVHGDPDTDATFFRTPARYAPHNVIVKARELIAQHTVVAAPREQFAYADSQGAATAVTEGAAAAGIALDFGGGVSRPSWLWDAAADRYLRSQNGSVDLDAHGAQLAATNVVVLRVPVTTGLGVPKTELIGSGEALVSSAGKTVQAIWSKRSQEAPVRLVDDSGVAVRLAPGTTWVELVPDAGAVDVLPADGE